MKELDNKETISFYKKGSDNVHLGSSSYRKKTFRWLALIPSFFAIFLGIFYLSELSLLFWHPVLGTLVEIVYFPFFIFSEEVNRNIYIFCSGMSCIPNPITCGLAVLLVLSILYSSSKKTFFIFGKYLSNRSLTIITFIFLAFLFLIPSLILSNINQKKCQEEKKKAPSLFGQSQLIEAQGLISFDLKKMVRGGLFYSLNGISYLFDGWNPSHIVAITEQGKEIEKSCKLETNPHLSFVHPISLFTWYDTPSWNEKRNAYCRARGFSSEMTKECVESLLKKPLEKLTGKNYEVVSSGDLIMNGNLIDDSGVYSDSRVSFKIDKNVFEYDGGDDPPKIGVDINDINAGKFAFVYAVRKVFGYEKMSDAVFPEPLMEIIIPNPSNPHFDVTSNDVLSSAQVINESKIKLGGYEYTRKILIGGDGNEYAFYDTQIDEMKVRVSLLSRQYFEKYPDLQKEFEEIISSIKYK